MPVGVDGDPPTRWGGSVAQVLASSTGGVGTHVYDLSRGLVAGGAAVTVCGPAATAEQFAFARTGAGFRPVEIPARPRPSDARAVRRLRRHLAELAPMWCAHGLRAGLAARWRCGGGCGAPW